MAQASGSRPRIIGHRGAAASAPENTLVSLREARRLGASWVEFDVKLSADGVPMLMHDESLKRTTGLDRDAGATSWAEIRRLDAGAWKAAHFAREPVPSFEAAIACLAEEGLGANIEIKTGYPEARATAEALGRMLERHWPRGAAPPLISSFDLPALEAMQALAPQWPRGLLLKELKGDWRGLLDRLGAATLNLDHRPLDAAKLASARAAGRPVLCYTVNEPARARQLFAWGVSAVFTDRPDALLTA